MTARALPAPEPGRDTPPLAAIPEATLRLLRGRLHGRSLLDLQWGHTRVFDELLETFVPRRLVAMELDTPAMGAHVPEPAGAFDGVFLLGLLPHFVDMRGQLFEEVERLLAPGGLLIASTATRPRRAERIEPGALARARARLDISHELTRGRFELLALHTGVAGLGRMLLVAQKPEL